MADTEDIILSINDDSQEECENIEPTNEQNDSDHGDDFSLRKNKENDSQINKVWSEKKGGSEAEICRNFCNNRCTRGALCKFRHPKPESSKSYERNRSRSPVSKSSESSSAVCRDYLRNMCTRGNDCRFYHPPDGEVDKRSWFTLCLDFQNGKCSRHDCRYFHLTSEDEELFREAGEISLHIIDQAMRKALTLDVASKSSRPTCKDYLKGLCKLRTCRYRHVSRREYEDEVYKALKDELYILLGPEKKVITRESPMGYSKPLLPHGGPFDSPWGGRSRNQSGERMGPSSFSDFRGGPVGRETYPPEPYSFGMRNSPEFIERPPADSTPSFSRDTRQNDVESLRRDYSQLQNHLYQVKREKQEEILSLERKLDHYRDGNMYNSNFSQNSFDDLRTSNDNVMKMNRQLQLDIERLHARNEELLRDLKASENWERIYSDTKIKLQNVQSENQECLDKFGALNAEISAQKREIQSWEGYQDFVKEHAYKLQNQLLVAENELSQSWGGGPPPLVSQREAWSHLKSILMLIINPTTQKDAGGTSFSSAGNSFSTGSFSERNTWNENCGYPGGNSPYPQMYNQSNQNLQSRGRMDGPK